MYLRLSVTAACDLRCLYCRPRQVGEVGGELTTARLLTLVAALHRHQPITKLRLTGGEPLLRRDLPLLVCHLRALLPTAELCLTTNGQRLAGAAADLKHAGLDRLNVSLDALAPQAFAAITGGGDVAAVCDGMTAARAAGFSPLKVNVVLLRQHNGGRLAALVAGLAAKADEVRFIELMPIGAARPHHPAQYYSAGEALAELCRAFGAAEPLGRQGTAVRYRIHVDGQAKTIGFITAVSQPFCDGCDRVRLDARGRLYACLRDTAGVDLAGELGDGATAELEALIATELGGKPRLATAWPPRTMIAIGG